MNQIVTVDKKKSLDEIARQEDTLLHNSNMANLVVARRNCLFGIEAAKSEIDRLEKLATEIQTFSANESNLMNTTEVKRFFDEASKSPAVKNPRW